MTTAWLVASAILFAALVPCFVACVRGDSASRLVALEMGSVVQCLFLITLSEAFHRVVYFDLAVALALLSFGGGLTFARFLERRL